jgi:prophage antirepressor-like protein
MSLPTIVTDIYENIIKFNNVNIVLLFDDDNNIWFSYNGILESIGYTDIKKKKNRLQLDNKYFDTYENIYSTSSANKSANKSIHPHTKMINEPGLYLLLSKSNKELAKKLLEKMMIDVLPSIRKKGSYSLRADEKAKLRKLTQKLKLKSREQLLHNRTSKNYSNITGKGFIYVLKVKALDDGREKQCYKIGYTSNLNKRLATYKTGHPDIELAHQENVNCNKKQLEQCVLNLNILKKLTSRNEILCDRSLKEIKDEIEDCKKLIKKHTSSNNY